MKLKQIKIKNVKGIENNEFNFDLYPNKPCIFVAPNGFGKSSFAIAFDSLTRDKITLDEKNLHNNNILNLPEINIEFEDCTGITSLHANSTSNTINSKFDTFVINSQIMAKATKIRINGNTIAKSSLEIQPTTLINTIPQKVDFNYNFTEAKKTFGNNGKILPNISEVFKSQQAILKIDQTIALNKFNGVKISNKIQTIINEINNMEGSAQVIKDWINTNKILDIQKISELYDLSKIIDSFNFNFKQHDADTYLASIQFIHIYKTLNLDYKKAVKYLSYINDKKLYENLISSFNTTRYKIKPREDKKHGLIVEWPKASEISNGQRDVLTFITLLMKAKSRFKNKNCILIIDEIFDYLDDANLITFQYFISDMINKLKKDGYNFFPILMTHLDPFCFNHFCFNKTKIQVVYLKEMPYSSNPNLHKLLRHREDATIKQHVDLYFFHYNPNTINISNEFSNLGLLNNWSDSSKFNSFIDKEVNKYLNDTTNYDPLAICVGVRIKIEEKLYNSIKCPVMQQIFIDMHGTKKKLDYCESIGICVPEFYYLLGIIYNDTLHLRDRIDISRPVAIKIENMTIKKMINDIFI